MMQRSRITALAAGLVALAAGTAWADDISVFDTGTDANGRVLGFGNSDPHWQIVQVPAGSGFVPPSAAIVAAAHPAYIQNDAVGSVGSSWIAPGSDTDGFYAAGNYVYRTSFDLSGLAPESASLTGALASDDNVLDVLVNGVSLGITGGGFQNMNTTFTISAGFVDGSNTLDIVVRNAAAGPHGLRVRLDGTADPAVEPDTTPPAFDGVADFTFECTGSPIALDAAELGITATDEVDGDVDVTLSPSSVDGLGEHTVTATASDAAGNVATATFTVSVVDTTAPVVTSISWVLESLRGKSQVEVQVTLTVEAEDACDPAPTSRIVGVSSDVDQSSSRRRRRRASTTSESTGDLSVVLRAENRSRWNGRTFVITVETSDASGNVTTSFVRIGGDDMVKASRSRTRDDDDDDDDDDDCNHGHDRDGDGDDDHENDQGNGHDD